MPLLGTRGAASARGFGMFGGNKPQSYWIAELSGGSGVNGYAAAVDSSGNLYAAGYTNGSVDVFITKYDSSGIIQWQKSLGQTSYFDFGWAVAIDSSSNVYVTGSVYDAVAGSSDVLIAKYNTSGSLQWQKKLEDTYGSDRGDGIAVDSSNNVYVVGRHTKSVATKAFVAQYDSSGSVSWQRELGVNTGADTFGFAAAVDSSNNVYAFGVTLGSGAGGHDAILAKYNSSGVIQWQRTFGDANTNFGYGVAVDSSGNIYITGDTDSTTVFVAKYNTSGSLQWQRTLTGAGTEGGRAIATDSSGNVYITGWTTTSGAGSQDILIVKYNSSGSIQWQRVFGSTGVEFGRGISIGQSASVHIVGTNDSTSATLFVKVPGDGTATGTYGGYTYAAAALTDSAGSYTSSTATLTDAADSFSDGTPSLTSATTTFTSTVTTI